MASVLSFEGKMFRNWPENKPPHAVVSKSGEIFQLFILPVIDKKGIVTIQGPQMGLNLTPQEHIARARAEMRMGAGIVLCTPEARWLAVSAEAVTEERFAAMKALGSIELVLTNWRAETLKTWANAGDVARLELGDNTLAWARSMADPSDDLSNPLKGPFQPVFGADADAHRAALTICKGAYLLPAVLLVEVPRDFESDLHCIELALISEALGSDDPMLHPVVHAPVPLSYSKNSRVYVFRPSDGGEEHYAIEVGHPDRARPVLSRLHSACFTGDIIGSLKCDCGHQLHAAMSAIGSEGAGVLLYLNQEGRGIGLANKMRAYSLQAEGFDTVEANHRLGFEDDERNFRIGAEILRLMGFSETRLMTNNPAKVENMERSGVKVTERVPLVVGQNPLNEAYLTTKAKKSGHIL